MPFFGQALVRAYNAIDEIEFDRADTARSRNDQAYFLFLFTRLEDAVNSAFKELIDIKAVGMWQDNLAWIVWKGHKITEIYLMTKVELLAEKGASDCEEIRRLYKDRNLIGHGAEWQQTLSIHAWRRNSSNPLTRAISDRFCHIWICSSIRARRGSGELA